MAVNKFLTISTVAIGFVLGVFTAPAKADMPVTGPTSQPVGHYVFCPVSYTHLTLPTTPYV